MTNLKNQITEFEQNFWLLLKQELKNTYNIDITEKIEEENSLNFGNNNFLNALLGVLYQQTTPVKKALYTVLCQIIPKELKFQELVSFNEFSELIDHIIEILVKND